MLNYKKGLSKDTIRILSERFKLKQEAFNRPYELKVPVTPKVRNARLMNTHAPVRQRTAATGIRK
jgi:HTH-type transcriptional regulator/antitoxin HigA